MKKILGLTLVALMVMGLVGGGTWAYFSDVETSSSNIFTAGTLDLQLTGGTAVNHSVTGTFGTANWAPGLSTNATLNMSNLGTVNMSSLSLQFTYGTNGSFDNGSTNTTGRPLYISGSPWTTDPTDYFDKMIWVDNATWQGESLDGTGGKYALIGKTLYDLRNGGSPLNVTLHAVAPDTVPLPGSAANYPLFLSFSFNGTATNGTQGNVLTMKITVTGSQQ